MVTAPPTPRETCLLYRDLNGREPELAVSGQGVYLTLEDGRVQAIHDPPILPDRLAHLTLSPLADIVQYPRWVCWCSSC